MLRGSPCGTSVGIQYLIVVVAASWAAGKRDVQRRMVGSGKPRAIGYQRPLVGGEVTIDRLQFAQVEALYDSVSQPLKNNDSFTLRDLKFTVIIVSVF